MAEFQPGEFKQEIYVDPKTGARYDAQTGNPISDVPHQSFDRNAIAYYTANGQPLRYANVYPGPVNVHNNQSLTDMSVAYELDSGMFIAPELAPISTRTKRSDIYFKISRDDVTRDYGSKLVRAIGGTANDAQQAFDTTNYQAIDYAIRDFVPDKVAANADEALQLMQSTTKFLTDIIEVGYERRVVSKMFGTANFTNTTFAAATSDGSGTINTATNTNRYINQAFNTVRANMILANNGKPPTHVAMNVDVAQRIAASPEISEVVKYEMGVKYETDGGWSGPNYGLPDKLYGLKVAVQALPSNSAAKGQAASFAALLTNTIGFFVVENPGLKTKNCTTTFRVGGLTVRSYRDEARKGTFVEVEMDQDENITNSYGGYLLTGA